MKESLAARQAALLRQNAELDQKVEAIEQRRQQQLQNAKATATSASNLTDKGHEMSPAEPVSGVNTFSDDGHGSLDGDAMSSPERTASAASRLGLKSVSLSASIDSAGKASDKPEKNDSGAVGARPPRSVTMAAARRKSHLKRDKSLDSLTAGTTGSDSARKPLRRHRTGLAGDGSVIHETKQEASSPDTTQGGVDEDDLGLEATVRYQKARLRVLQDELDVAQRDLKDMQVAQQQSKATIEELTTENAALKKKQLQTQQLLDKQQDLSAAQESKQKILETQLSTAQAKMDEMQRAEKQASQQFRTKDVRLNRALEELEKVKAQLHDERRAQGEQSVSKAEYEQVIKDNKRLDKQKNELLVAFKKQMKLIDLLKRQRIHMEAAKMLSFTEEEFSKTLELG